MQASSNHWISFVMPTVLALGTWALAVAHGHGWQMVWLPAAVAGAAWPGHSRPRRDCTRTSAKR
jgi:hypothetical protein